MQPFDLKTEYLLIEGRSTEKLQGGSAFWERLAADPAHMDRVGRGWLVGSYPAHASWDSWERHPDGDEVVHLLRGRLRIITSDDPDGFVLDEGGTVVLPAGVWHTVDVIEPGETLHVTYGRGTEHKAR